jgi:hypothetical protein
MNAQIARISIAAAIASLGILNPPASAQTAPPRPIPQIDLTKADRVASPNRTLSSTLSADRTVAQRFGITYSASPAVLLVDSGGRTLGRWMHTSAGPSALTLFNNETLLLMGLQPDFHAAPGSYRPPGLTWDVLSFGLTFTSSDCSGTPYLSGSAYGALLSGVPFKDVDQVYIYIARDDRISNVEFQSNYNDGTCYSHQTALSAPLTPVMAVVPASNFGRPPFFLK